MAYNVGTAERDIKEHDFGLEQADALDSMNLSGIHISKMKDFFSGRDRLYLPPLVE